MSNKEPVLFTRFYAFTLWVFDRVESFPKLARFTLGDRVLSATLDVLERIVMAQYARKKQDMLDHANLRLQSLRVLMRLSKDREHVGFRVWPHRRRIKKSNLKRMKARLRWMAKQRREGRLSPDEIGQRIRCWLAHAEHGDTRQVTQAVLRSAVF